MSAVHNKKLIQGLVYLPNLPPKFRQVSTSKCQASLRNSTTSFTGCTSEKRRLVRTRRTPPRQTGKASMIEKKPFWQALPMLFWLPWTKWKLLTSDSDFPNLVLHAVSDFKLSNVSKRCLKKLAKIMCHTRSLWVGVHLSSKARKEQQQKQQHQQQKQQKNKNKNKIKIY